MIYRLVRQFARRAVTLQSALAHMEQLAHPLIVPEAFSAKIILSRYVFQVAVQPVETAYKPFDPLLHLLRTFLAFIDRFNILVAAVEIQPTNWLTVIVVEQDTEIGLRIAMHYPVDVIHFIVKDSPDDTKPLQFSFGNDDFIFIGTFTR